LVISSKNIFERDSLNLVQYCHCTWLLFAFPFAAMTVMRLLTVYASVVYACVDCNIVETLLKIPHIFTSIKYVDKLYLLFLRW